MTKHPIQPLLQDEKGTLRFKENKIVRYILDNGGIDLNQIAAKNFSQEDQEQFAQLIGYSHSGAGDLSYFSDETWMSASIAYEQELPELKAKLQYYEEQIKEIKQHTKAAAVAAFGIHPDDLERF